jgi:CHAT domain-containing protein/lipopolysaccharide biosynthesis regulator YciM
MIHSALKRSLLPSIHPAVLLIAITLASAPANLQAQAPGSAVQPQNDAQAKVKAEAQRLNGEVFRLSQAGRYDEALPLAERAVTLIEKELGAEHPYAVSMLVNLASLYLVKKDTARADKLAQRAITLLNKVANPGAEEAQVWLNLTALYRALGEPRNAALVCQRAVETLERSLGPEHPQVGEALNELASLAQEGKDYARAEALYRRALSITEKHFGAEHTRTAQALRLLANICREQKDFAHAEPLYQRALAILEENFGEEHTNLAATLNDFGLLYISVEQYGQAKALFERALQILEQQFGLDDVRVISVLNNLADLYHRQGDLEKAIQTRQRALATAEKVYDKKHPDVETLRKNISQLKNAKRDLKPRSTPENGPSFTAEKKTLEPRPINSALASNGDFAAPLKDLEARSGLGALIEKSKDLKRSRELMDQVFAHRRAGRYDNAILPAKAWLAMEEKIYGAKSTQAAFVCLLLGELYSSRGDFTQAELFLQRALTIKEKAKDAKILDIVLSLDALANLHFKKGAYSQAEAFHLRTLTIAEKNASANPELLAAALVSLASFYQARGNYKQAEQFYRRGVEILERLGGGSLPEALIDLANLYKVTAEYEKAEPLLKRAVNLYEQAKEPNPEYTSNAQLALGVFYQLIDDYQQAEVFHQRAVALIEKTHGEDAVGLVRPLIALAGFYIAYGKYEKAEPLFRRAQQLTVKLQGPEHPMMAFVLENYARLFMGAEDYLKAEALAQQALTVNEKVYGAGHDAIVAPLTTLGDIYRKRRDYSQAQQFYQRAIAAKEKALGPEHPDLAGLLNNLALVYKTQKQYDRAEQTLLRALALVEKAFGADNPNIVSTLNSLASLRLARRDYEQAETFHQRAYAISEKVFGAESLHTVSMEHLLAILNWEKGNLTKAESLYQRVIAYYEKRSGAQSGVPAGLLDSYAWLCLAKGDVTQATALLTRSNELTELNISLNLAAGSERQKQLFLATFAEHINSIVTLHVQHAPDAAQAARMAVTTILRNKGRTLDVMADSFGALRRRLNPQDRVLLDQLGEIRSQLSTLILRGPSAGALAQYQAEIKRLEEEVEKLEAEITTRSARIQKSGSSVSLAEIQAALPPDAKLVEFAVYRPESKDAASPPRYVAYVIGAQGDPAWVELGEAPEINQLVAALRDALRNSQRADVKAAARALDEKVMRPVRKLLGTARVVLLSPDGALNLVPFAALVDEQQHYLVEQYTFSYLTSGRDLLRLQTPAPSRQESLIVANPDFGARATANNAKRGPVYDPLGLANIDIEPLPGTAEEAQSLRTLLPQSSVLTGAGATESQLKQATAPKILHIATHGFFLEDVKAEPAPTIAERLLLQQIKSNGEERLERALINPLLRSGLVLAGANARKSGADDGILTAFEAASLDLLGSRLVVLSACDTGVGEVKNGDGVYGLRRALTLAGAETQMMSLWPVSDQGTRDLMIEYYKALLAGQGRSEGLRQVQLQMLKNEKRRHPYYWASFIVSGEWANLDGKR